MMYIIVHNGRLANFIDSEIKPVFTPDYLVLDAANYEVESLKEGYLYDADSDSFSESEYAPVSNSDEISQPTPDEQLLMEIKYQTLLLETMSLGGKAN